MWDMPLFNPHFWTNFQFPEPVVTSTVKESLRSTDRSYYKFSLFYRSTNCGEQLLLTNFGREGKPTLQLSVFHYQVFLSLDTYNTDAIATCKLNFTVFYNVLSYEFAAG